MAPPLSVDLRERVIKAWRDGGETYAELAERFGVGYATVSRWLRRYRETGGVEPTGHRGGAPRRITSEQEPFIERLVLANPDWTEAQLTTALREQFGIEVSRSTVGRRIRKLGYRLKKRHSSPASGIASPSFRDESSTSSKSETSNLRVWFLLTKPAQTSR
jgi:transposase